MNNLFFERLFILIHFYSFMYRYIKNVCISTKKNHNYYNYRHRNCGRSDARSLSTLVILVQNGARVQLLFDLQSESCYSSLDKDFPPPVFISESFLDRTQIAAILLNVVLGFRSDLYRRCRPLFYYFYLGLFFTTQKRFYEII